MSKPIIGRSRTWSLAENTMCYTQKPRVTNFWARTLSTKVSFQQASSMRTGNYAILLADQAAKHATESVSDRVERQRLFDDALRLALENVQAADRMGVLYSRFDAHRCLADVRFRRGELADAERECATINEFISETESRVSQLWLGPLYLDVLLAVAERAELEGKADLAALKRS